MTKIENNVTQTGETSSEPEKWIQNWMIYLDDMHSSLLNEMEAKSLNREGVLAYIQHIPKEGINDGWPLDIYKITGIMIQELYVYSREMKIIPDTMTYDEFVKQ